MARMRAASSVVRYLAYSVLYESINFIITLRNQSSQSSYYLWNAINKQLLGPRELAHNISLCYLFSWFPIKKERQYNNIISMNGRHPLISCYFGISNPINGIYNRNRNSFRPDRFLARLDWQLSILVGLYKPCIISRSCVLKRSWNKDLIVISVGKYCLKISAYLCAFYISKR